MKKIIIKNKKWIAIGAIALVLSSSIVAISYRRYKNNIIKENIEMQIVSIFDHYNTFNNGENRNSKIESLKFMVGEYENYKNENEIYDSVSKEYLFKIELMKKYFVDLYDITLKENTLNNIQEIKDKENINTAKTNLESLLKTVKSEELVVSDKNTADKYAESIETLIKLYDERLNSILDEEKRVEEERVAKEEAERIAQEEAIKRQSQNNSNSGGSNSGNSNSNNNSDSGASNNSGNSGSGSSSGGNSGGGSRPKPGVDLGGLENSWLFDLDTGEKIPESDVWIDRSNGDTYDANGNFLYNGFDW